MTRSIEITVLESLGHTLIAELRANDVEDSVFDLEASIRPFNRGDDCYGIPLGQVSHNLSINAVCYIERPWRAAKRHFWLGFEASEEASFDRLVRAAVRLGFRPPLSLSKKRIPAGVFDDREFGELCSGPFANQTEDEFYEPPHTFYFGGYDFSDNSEKFCRSCFSFMRRLAGEIPICRGSYRTKQEDLRI